MGEMENNAVIAHGLSAFMKESMMERSDKYPFYIDNESKNIVGLNPKKGVFHDIKDYSRVHLPYAFKLLSQELGALSIGMKFVTEHENHEKNEGNVVYDDLVGGSEGGEEDDSDV